MIVFVKLSSSLLQIQLTYIIYKLFWKFDNFKCLSDSSFYKEQNLQAVIMVKYETILHQNKNYKLFP